MASADKTGQLKTGFRIQLIIYSVINLLVKGTQLMISVISSSLMVSALLSGNEGQFENFLKDVGNRAIWMGPYPENYTLLTYLAYSGENFQDKLEGTPVKIMETIKTEENMNDFVALYQIAQTKIGLHIWSSNILSKCIVFILGWLLLFSAKKQSFPGCLVWISISVPIFLQYVLGLFLDLILGDFLRRQIHFQIVQGLDVGFQFVGIISVSAFLIQLHRSRNPSTGGVTLPELAEYEPDGEVSIRQAIRERY